MIPSHFISAFGNHLWQSTLFAAVAGLLTLLLKRHQAKSRYWLWLIASIKFLVPFSVLVALGSHLGWSTATPVADSGFTFVQEVGQPFAAPVTRWPSPAEPTPASSPIPIILALVWMCGCVAVVVSWWIRSRRVRSAARAGRLLGFRADVPVVSSTSTIEPGIFGIFHPVLLLPEGIREHLAPEQLEAILAHELCHVRRRDNLAAAVHMLVEAVFWFHPLVWWIGARLVEERERACDEEVVRLGNEPQVYAESILKTCQFYLESPLPCMSGVTGSDLKKRIVRIMARQIEHPLGPGRKLLLIAAGLAAVAGPMAFGIANAPQAPNQATAQPQPAAAAPAFDVVSIKPNKSGERMIRMGNRPGGFSATNVTVKMLMRMAYGVQDFQISGAPNWFASDHYDVEAKSEGAADDLPPWKLSQEQRNLYEEKRRLMVQALLADRFQLKIHRETKELPIYALVIAKNGPKLQPAKDLPMPPDMKDMKPDSRQQIPDGRVVTRGDAKGPGPDRPDVMRTDGKGPGPDGQIAVRADGRGPVPFKGRGMRMRPGELTANGAELRFLVESLSNQLGRTVIDKTGLKGVYDFDLKWTPDESQMQMMKGPGGPEGPGPGDGGAGRPPGEGPPPPDSNGPSIFTAIQEQLGLKLESQKGPVEILVIDRLERPSEN